MESMITIDDDRITRVKPEQQTMAGFAQEPIEEVEKWAAKYDAAREKVRKAKEAQANMDMKLREAMHLNQDALSHQESEDGDKLLVYKRPGFNIVVKRGKEKVNVKIGDDDKGDTPDDDENDDEE